METQQISTISQRALTDIVGLRNSGIFPADREPSIRTLREWTMVPRHGPAALGAAGAVFLAESLLQFLGLRLEFRRIRFLESCKILQLPLHGRQFGQMRKRKQRPVRGSRDQT
jgi:hypothetical protein